MKTKLHWTFFVLVVATLLFSAAAATIIDIPASEKGRENGRADNSPAIDEGWELTPRPYYVDSDDPALKALLGVNHEFPGVFSTELTQAQVGLLNRLGIKTKPVQIYHITVRPFCGDGTLHPSEGCDLGYTCPEGFECVDCKCIAEDEEPVPEERTCYPSDQTPWGIEKVYGDTTITTTSGGAGVVVAVLDTGVDQDHPDLAANIVDCVTKVTRFVPDTKSCEDGNGHGTHVSGTVLANAGSDGLGIYGVAPNASLMAVKVCDKRGACYGDDIAAGIRHAADNRANIISMSFGGDTPDSQVLAAIDHAVTQGVLPVAAAGNDGPADGSINYPAAYAKVIAAGAIDINEVVPDWSSRGLNDGDYLIGEKEVEFGTPGVNIESTSNDGCYAYMSGTSMATPHVSGFAAKLWNTDAATTRTNLQELAKLHDLHTVGDDTATGLGLPVAP